MTTFTDPILAGDTLVRDAIKSENFDAGNDGWRVQRTGNAEFNNLTARGTIESTIFAPGSDGWQLDDGGTAEFNDLTARGSIVASEVDVDNGDAGRARLREGLSGFGPRFDLEIGQDNINANIGSGFTESEDGGWSYRVSSAWEAPLWQFLSSRFDGNVAGEILLYGESGDDAVGTSSYKPARVELGSNVWHEAAAMRPQQDSSTTDVDFSGDSSFAQTTTCSVTFVAPPSGVVSIHWYDESTLEKSASGSVLSRNGHCSARVREGSTVGSGTIVSDASLEDSVTVGTRGDDEEGGTNGGASFRLVSGLTPGDTYHVLLCYRVNTTSNINDATSDSRRILVRPEM